MKPVKFKHHNVVFAEDQPEYQPLPALKIEGPEGHVVSCWKLSFWERLRVIFLGRIWLNLMMFNQPLTPSYLSTKRKEVFSLPDDNITMWKKLFSLNVGTKSVLFGAHCFFLHPFFVAIAWIKLYGLNCMDFLLIHVFGLHFLCMMGYWGKPNMDGPEGETHVEFGAKIMSVFGKEWSDFSMYHSRYYAKNNGAQPSKLCFADKLSFVVTPRWLYLPAVNATGEIHEYLKNAKKPNQKNWKPVEGQKVWHQQLCEYMTKWVDEHKDGSIDTWTNSDRHGVTESGVWK